MKTRFFTQIDYKPNSITHLSSIETYNFIFSSNKTLGIISTITSQIYRSFFFGGDTCETIVHYNTLVCASDIDEVTRIYLDNLIFDSKKLGSDVTGIILISDNIHLNAHNGFILEHAGTDLLVIYKSNCSLNCPVYCDDYFISGGTNKVYILTEDFMLK